MDRFFVGFDEQRKQTKFNVNSGLYLLNISKLSSKTLLASDLASSSYRFYDYYDNYRIIQNYITK
jgi:hypothetical protein